MAQALVQQGKAQRRRPLLPPGRGTGAEVSRLPAGTRRPVREGVAEPRSHRDLPRVSGQRRRAGAHGRTAARIQASSKMPFPAWKRPTPRIPARPIAARWRRPTSSPASWTRRCRCSSNRVAAEPGHYDLRMMYARALRDKRQFPAGRQPVLRGRQTEAGRSQALDRTGRYALHGRRSAAGADRLRTGRQERAKIRRATGSCVPSFWISCAR